MLNPIPKRFGCWLHYQLKLNGLTQEDVAKIAHRSQRMVSHFLVGRKGSLAVQEAVCEVLGYDSFTTLIATWRKEEEATV
jgi:predicted transcriptional regulator